MSDAATDKGPQSRLGQRERCLFRHQDKIATQRHLGSRASRRTVDGGDHRLR